MRTKWVRVSADDHRRNDPEFQGARLAANMELADGLRRLAESRGKTAAHLAIGWRSNLRSLPGA
jgi:aryl-alcohol dehydrogenase-like predicted oxidoreductase